MDSTEQQSLWRRLGAFLRRGIAHKQQITREQAIEIARAEVARRGMHLNRPLGDLVDVNEHYDRSLYVVWMNPGMRGGAASVRVRKSDGKVMDVFVTPR
jgi:hypothetical protein